MGAQFALHFDLQCLGRAELDQGLSMFEIERERLIVAAQLLSKAGCGADHRAALQRRAQMIRKICLKAFKRSVKVAGVA